MRTLALKELREGLGIPALFAQGNSEEGVDAGPQGHNPAMASGSR